MVGIVEKLRQKIILRGAEPAAADAPWVKSALELAKPAILLDDVVATTTGTNRFLINSVLAGGDTGRIVEMRVGFVSKKAQAQFEAALEAGDLDFIGHRQPVIISSEKISWLKFLCGKMNLG